MPEGSGLDNVFFQRVVLEAVSTQQSGAVPEYALSSVAPHVSFPQNPAASSVSRRMGRHAPRRCCLGVRARDDTCRCPLSDFGRIALTLASARPQSLSGSPDGTPATSFPFVLRKCADGRAEVVVASRRLGHSRCNAGLEAVQQVGRARWSST